MNSISPNFSRIDSGTSRENHIRLTYIRGRQLLMLSSGIMLSGLLCMAGLGVDQPVSEQRTKGIIAMIIVFGVGFATGWGPLTYVVSTEVTSLRLRDLTTRLGFTVNVCFK
jgi:hypothetical protein